MGPGTGTVLERRRFDVDEYYRLARAGILQEDDRVQLLDGELVEMPAVGSRHLSSVGRLNRLMVRALGDRAFVSVQGPIRLDRFSEPEPDVALLRPRADDYGGAIPEPEDTLLVIEVAASSLPIDRKVKLPLYAAAGIPEVWIVDLERNTVEVHRNPRASGYEIQTTITSGTLSPSAFPEVELEVMEILPPAC